jgi:hypothetical protein
MIAFWLLCFTMPGFLLGRWMGARSAAPGARRAILGALIEDATRFAAHRIPRCEGETLLHAAQLWTDGDMDGAEHALRQFYREVM